MSKIDYDIEIKIPVQLRIWNKEETDIENKMDLMLDSAVIKDDTLEKIYRDIDDYINNNVMRNR